MFRATRPLFQSLASRIPVPPAATSAAPIGSVSSKRTTNLVGLAVRPDALPALQSTLSKTLGALSASSIPSHSVYRQSVETSVKHKLSVIENAKGDVAAVENQLGEGQIEEVLVSAETELGLVGKMAEWQP